MYKIKYSLFWEPTNRGVIVVEAANSHSAYAMAYNMLIKKFGTAIVVGAIKECRGAK